MSNSPPYALPDSIATVARFQGMTFREVHALCLTTYEDLECDQEITRLGDTWTVEKAFPVCGFGTTGFAGYRIRKRGGWTAIAFRGTQPTDLEDQLTNAINGLLYEPLPPQYVQGAEIVGEEASDGRPDTILVGHSLGGGIAAFCSARFGNPAATIFPTPVVVNGAASNVVNYICEGEFMSSLFELEGSGGFFGHVNRRLLSCVFGDCRPHRRLGVDSYIESIGTTRFEKHFLKNVKL